MSKAWAQAHGVTEPADFVAAREETYASRHANGTGPFMLEIVRAARRLGHGPQSRLVGHGGGSAQRRPCHPCRQSRSRERRCLARRRDRSPAGPYPTGPSPDPRQPRAEACLSAQVAHDVLRPRSGQRRAALIQHQGAQPIQGQASAPGDGRGDRHRTDPARPHGRALHPSRHDRRPGREWLRPGTGSAATLQPRESQGIADRSRLPGWLQRDA